MKAKQFWKRGVALAVTAVTLLGTTMPMQADAAWRQDDAKWWWQRDDGSYPASSWESINGTWYYFDETGYMATGWQFVNGAWYYLGEPGDGAMKTGWQFINGAWYYLGGSGDGAMKTGWQFIDGSWYYLGGSGDGTMKTGWQQVGGTWYYLYDDGRMAADTVIDGYYLDGSGAWVQDANQGQTGGSSISEGWVQSGGFWWYQNADGSYPANAWKQIGGKWYYFDAAGWMATGWQQIGGDWYYLGEAGDGVMRSSQWVGNYYVKEDGRMATNQWVGEYYVGADGAWIPGASANNSQQNEGDTGSSTGNSQQNNGNDGSSTGNSQQNGNQSNDNGNGNAQNQVTIEEQVLLDQNGIRITAKDLKEEYGLLTLRMLIENHTSKDIVVQTRNDSMNGFMVTPLFSPDVNAGENAYGEMVISRTSLEKAGVGVVRYIRFSFDIFERETYADLIETGMVTIYTSAALQSDYMPEPEKQEVNKNEMLVLDQNGIIITVKGVENDSFGTNIKLLIENNSQQDVTIQVRSVSVNGYMIDPIFSCDVLAGKRANHDITFLKQDLHENDITSIDDVELIFHVFEYGFGPTVFNSNTVHMHFQY